MATIYAQLVQQIRIVFYLGREVNCMEASTETEHKVLESLFPTIQTLLFPSLHCISSLFNTLTAGMDPACKGGPQL